jgi:capsular polysaccharide transport system permease protein
LKLVEAVSALFLIGVSAGIIVGILSEFVPSLGTFLMPVQRILYFISGVFFLPDAMPPAIRDIIGWNPLLHGITLFRTGYYPGYFSHMLDVAYLWKFAAASVLIALIIERMSRKHIGNLD